MPAERPRNVQLGPEAPLSSSPPGMSFEDAVKNVLKPWPMPNKSPPEADKVKRLGRLQKTQLPAPGAGPANPRATRSRGSPQERRRWARKPLTTPLTIHGDFGPFPAVSGGEKTNEHGYFWGSPKA